IIYRSNKLYTQKLIYVFAAYIVAKLFEHLDVITFELTGFVSGHTIKHLVSALAIYWVYKIFKKETSK
ncbi:MAG: hypothetical protein ACPGSL_07185, partial [Vicingaceae bacterium]